MAEMTIRLQIDPQTGKRDIIVTLRADDDSLPHEHEQQHRALVDKLIEGGLLKAGEAGRVIVERGEEESESGGPVTAPREERKSASEGA